MTTTTPDVLRLPRDLGDGLVLRATTAADADALADFDARIFANRETDEPAEWARLWTLDMIGGTHPAIGPDDLLIVEDTRAGTDTEPRRIASAIHFISQTWTYAGIPLGVGRPELVGTHPDYRRCGLVRALFAYFHARSAARGELMQVITGIPWYYRQFGYEMALPLEGGRIVALSEIAPLKDGDAEPFTLRPATDADLPFLIATEAAHTAAHLFAAVRDDALWRYALTGMRVGSAPSRDYRVIVSAAGVAVGYIAHFSRVTRDGNLYVTRFALVPGVSWAAVIPTVLRALKATAEAYAAYESYPAARILFEIGAEHPAFTVAPRQFPVVIPPYAWYVRVPDLPAFLRQITPALERRLATSMVAGHTGELLLNFYRTGLRLAFTKGRLTAIETYTPDTRDRMDAGFPDHTFLQLVCGHRTVAELEYAFADVQIRTDTARALLTALFPKQFSDLWPVA